MGKLLKAMVYLITMCVGITGTVLWVQNDYSMMYGYGTNIAMLLAFLISSMMACFVQTIWGKD